MEKIFLRKNIIWYAFCSKFSTFTDLKNSSFFRNNPSIYSKNPFFVLFQKSYLFSRILRQICYNLVILKISRSEMSGHSVIRSRSLSIGESFWKKFALIGWVSFHITYRPKIKFTMGTVMTVRLPVTTRSLCCKIGVLGSFVISNLIVAAKINIQVWAPGCRQEWNIFCILREAEMSLWLEFWTTTFTPCANIPSIDLTAISNLRVSLLSISVQIASRTRFWTATTTLSTSFVTLSAKFLSVTWVWLWLSSSSVVRLFSAIQLLIQVSKVSFLLSSVWVLPPTIKPT